MVYFIKKIKKDMQIIRKLEKFKKIRKIFQGYCERKIRNLLYHYSLFQLRHNLSYKINKFRTKYFKIILIKK